jgi:hypothetical protein
MRPSESQILTYHDLIVSNPLATTAPGTPASYGTFAEYRQAADLALWFQGNGYHVSVTSGSNPGADPGSRQVIVNGVPFIVFGNRLVALLALAAIYGHSDASALAQAKVEGKIPYYDSIEIEVQQYGIVPGTATIRFTWSDGSVHDEPEPGTYQPIVKGGHVNKEPPPEGGAYQETGPAIVKKKEPDPTTTTQTNTPPQTDPTPNDGAAGKMPQGDAPATNTTNVMVQLWIILLVGFALWKVAK